MQSVGPVFAARPSARRFARVRDFVGSNRAFVRRASRARVVDAPRPRAFMRVRASPRDDRRADSGLKCISTLFHRANVPRPTQQPQDAERDAVVARALARVVRAADRRGPRTAGRSVMARRDVDARHVDVAPNRRKHARARRAARASTSAGADAPRAV